MAGEMLRVKKRVTWARKLQEQTVCQIKEGSLCSDWTTKKASLWAYWERERGESEGEREVESEGERGRK